MRARVETGERDSGRPRTIVSRTVTEEAERYNNSVGGIDVEAVRMGASVRASHVLTAVSERFTFTGSKVGFPMASRATIPDGSAVVAYIRSATPGSRWCEIDLEAGDVLVYGGAAEHVARNVPGLDFMFAIADLAVLGARAEEVGRPLEAPATGRVHLVTRRQPESVVPRAFSSFARAAVRSEPPSSAECDDVLHAMTHAMSSDVVRVIGAANRIDSRHVVSLAIDYAESIDRIPGLSELCVATHVSERRLRSAFTAEFDVPPSVYFRSWALEKAHRRLVHGGDNETVTEVAAGLGFEHLGRFSGHYKRIYSESPSATLRGPRRFTIGLRRR